MNLSVEYLLTIQGRSSSKQPLAGHSPLSCKKVLYTEGFNYRRMWALACQDMREMWRIPRRQSKTSVHVLKEEFSVREEKLSRGTEGRKGDLVSPKN
ncbi:hypothetical protein NPIL_1131 [Nephila pilipes]|uniref:Uncharacterized protein n=1 Tax=Nephila pilipes TaxID=299642 RepID=A0A8X6NLG1_NEPPI|nr:hypothetical protein NPIL_1131 [Nephila pilipes]